jgi:hypothetical protein
VFADLGVELDLKGSGGFDLVEIDPDVPAQHPEVAGVLGFGLQVEKVRTDIGLEIETGRDRRSEKGQLEIAEVPSRVGVKPKVSHLDE